VWAGDPNPAVPLVEHFRLHQIFEELERLHVQPVPVIYADEAADDVRKRLLETDGVLVWVDPIVNGRDRSVLDAVLADVKRVLKPTGVLYLGLGNRLGVVTFGDGEPRIVPPRQGRVGLLGLLAQMRQEPGGVRAVGRRAGRG